MIALILCGTPFKILFIYEWDLSFSVLYWALEDADISWHTLLKW